MRFPTTYGKSCRPGYWDRVGNNTNTNTYQEQIALHKKRVNLDLVSAWAPVKNCCSILKTDLFEEAFGEDFLLDELSSPHTATVGMDVSKAIVSKAKKRFPKNPLLAADVSRLPFADERFELIVSNSTLDHLPFPSFPHALNELRRVLKPGGFLILTLDSRHNPVHVISNFIRKKIGMIHAERCYSIQETVRLLKGCGFHATHSKTIYHIPPGLNPLAKLLDKALGSRTNSLIKHMLHIFKRFDRLPTRLLTGRYIAVRAIKSDGSGIKKAQE